MTDLMKKVRLKTKILLPIVLSVFCGSLLVAPAHARTLSTYEQSLEDLDKDQYQAAELKLKKLVAQNPSDADAHAELGRAYMNQDKFEPAIAEDSRAIALNPKMERAYSNRAYCEFRSGRMKEGFADSDKAITYYAVNPLDWSIYKTYQNRAQALKMAKHIKEANAELEKARAYGLLAEAVSAREAGQLDVATQKLDAAVKVNPKLPDLWLMRGVINGNQNMQNAALADFSKAINLAPSVPMLYYFRADCYQQLSKHQEAIKDLTKIIDAKPKLVAYRLVCETGRLRNENMRDDTSPVSLGDVYVLRALSYSAIKKPELAAKDFEKAAKLDPTDDKALAKNAELVMDTGKYDQAIKNYTKSVAANPKDWTRYKERADAYMELGRKDEALADYSEVIKLTPKEPGAYMLRAVALKSMGKYSEAIPDFSRVLQLRTDDDDAYMERAECYRLMHQYDLALADLNKASALHPENNSFVKEARTKLLTERQGREQLENSESIATSKDSPAALQTTAKEQTQDDYRSLFLVIIIGGILTLLGLFAYSRKTK